MERNVVTLETAKKLKAAGFPQDNVNEWVKSPRMKSYVLEYKFPVDSHFDRIAAPIAQEIADQLPEESYELMLIWQINLKQRLYMVRRTRDLENDESWEEAYTMAEALAALWLKLQEAQG